MTPMNSEIDLVNPQGDKTSSLLEGENIPVYFPDFLISYFQYFSFYFLINHHTFDTYLYIAKSVVISFPSFMVLNISVVV